MDTFSVLLLTHRRRARLSLTELARKSGVSRGYLHLLERGESTPTIDIMQKLADGLGISLAELVGDSETLGLTDQEFELIALLRERRYPEVLAWLSAYMEKHAVR